MKIKDSRPLSMAEAIGYIKKDKDSETDVVGFIKKFNKTDSKKMMEIKERIEQLDLMKINDRHIRKIVDFLPEDKEDLNKIFNDVGLQEDETKKILDAIKGTK
ncbi:MAG: hypothetical protein ABIA78_00100 [archaeon]